MPRQSEPECFAEFWDIWRPYRRHSDGRGDARERYRKCLLNGADPQRIIDGAYWYTKNLKEADKPYIPLAATWLNKESYEDYADDKAAYDKRMQEIEDRKRKEQQARQSNVSPFELKQRDRVAS